MKGIGSRILLGLAMVGAMSSSALALTLDYSVVPGANVTFTGTGNTFTFEDASSGAASGYDFHITSSGSTMGLLGNITGTFTIIPPIIDIFGIQGAQVSGSGTFSIDDGTGNLFEAELDWVNITTGGIGGILNFWGTVNLTNLSYSGLNSTLLAMASAPNGVLTNTFQFSSPTSLMKLTEDGLVHKTSYSGSITVQPVPEPMSLLLLGSGLAGLGLARRKFGRG